MRAGHPARATVEEVAGLAATLGWSYETLMSMTLAERRMWLAATRALSLDRVSTTAGVPGPGEAAAPETDPVSPDADAVRLTTEEERRARLLEILRSETARRRR